MLDWDVLMLFYGKFVFKFWLIELFDGGIGIVMVDE